LHASQHRIRKNVHVISMTIQPREFEASVQLQIKTRFYVPSVRGGSLSSIMDCLQASNFRNKQTNDFQCARKIEGTSVLGFLLLGVTSFFLYDSRHTIARLSYNKWDRSKCSSLDYSMMSSFHVTPVCKWWAPKSLLKSRGPRKSGEQIIDPGIYTLLPGFSSCKVITIRQGCKLVIQEARDRCDSNTARV
jgi:hypothetical protein